MGGSIWYWYLVRPSAGTRIENLTQLKDKGKTGIYVAEMWSACIWDLKQATRIDDPCPIGYLCIQIALATGQST